MMANRNILILFCILMIAKIGYSQPCDSITPSFTIDLTGNADSVWISPDIKRDGLCCDAISPDVCIEFIVTLDPLTIGISLDIISGAEPPGALFYEVECEGEVAIGDTMCLSGPGPHRITFCKPGANKNTYALSAISNPGISGPIFVGNGCIDTLTVSGLEESTITWTSFPFNPAYDAYLSCTTGCDTTIVTGDAVAPDSVTYIATGFLQGACGGSVWISDTAVVYFISDKYAEILPEDPAVCFGGTDAELTAFITGGYPPYNYQWSTGESSQTISVGVGTYWVVISDVSDCPPVSDTVTVTAFTVPINADAGEDFVVCADDGAVQLEGLVEMASGGTWSGGMGTYSPSNDSLFTTYFPIPSEIAQGAMEFMLLTTGNGGCPPDSDYVTVTFSSTAIADYSYSQTCEGEITSFYNTSVVDTSLSLTWNWDFGNGNTSNVIQPSFVFGDAGYHSVVLSLISEGLCFDTVTKNVYVAPNPVADFSFAPLCVGLPVLFNDLSSIQAGSINEWEWDFGDGFPVLTQDASHVFSEPGAFPVTLSVVSDSGCVAATMQSVVLSEPLAGQINPQDPVVCYGASNAEIIAIAFNGIPPYSYLWNTGAADSSITVGVGEYWVEISDLSGCPGISDTVLVTEIIAPVTANAGEDVIVCSDILQVALSGTITGAPGAHWSGGNGIFLPSPDSLNVVYYPSVNENEEDSIVLMIESTGVGTCSSDSDYVSIFFSPPVEANFISQNTCFGDQTFFSNVSSYSSDVSTVWLWDFGDGVADSGFNTVHTFHTTGEYTVQLAVVSDSLCFDTAYANIVINPVPLAGFSYVGHCLNDPVFFSDTSYLETGTIVTWNWDFGDGGISEIQNPEHEYTHSGGYLVTLEVFSDSNCAHTVNLPIVLSPTYPTAGFDLSHEIIFPGYLLSITDRSENALQYYWSFGDGSEVSNLAEPEYAYADTGFYSIMQIVIDENGCTDTLQKGVLVQLPPLVPNAFSPNNDGINDIMYVTGGPFLEFEFNVFNQWGELLFTSSSQADGWDGTRAGKKQPMGVYVYTLKAVKYTNEEVVESGDITLLR